MQAATVVQFLPHFRRPNQQSHHQQRQQKVFSPAKMAASGLFTSRRFSSALGTIWTSTFMRRHSQLLLNLVVFNRHFASLLIFWFLLPMIVLSVYILCVLYFLAVPLLLRLYLDIIYLIMLLLFSVLALLPMVTRALYSADGQLYSAQMRCRMGSGEVNESSTFLRTKLKLMSYYEVLRTERKVTFTFGSHAKVENRWLLEVNA